jgi:hypothetical protein
MTDPDRPPRALVVAVDRTPAPLASLAARTLANLKSQALEGVPPHRLIVSEDGSAMFQTIGAALAVAIDGDEILVRPGDYRESLEISMSVTIQGDGSVDEILIQPSGELGCLELRAGEGTISGISFAWPESESIERRGFDSSLISITGGKWTLDDIRAGDFAGDAIRASGHSVIALRGIRVASRGPGVVVEGHASINLLDSEIEAFPTGVFINSSASHRMQRCRVDAEEALVVHNAASVVIDDNDLVGEVELHNVAIASVISNRLSSPTIGLVVEGGGGRYSGNQIDSRGIGLRVLAGQAVFGSNQIDADLTGVEIGADFSGRVEDHDVWGPYPSAVISVVDSPDCVLAGNKRRHSEAQSELDVREFGAGLGIRLSSTNQYGPTPLNIYDPGQPLPQENLFSAPAVGTLGTIAAPLEEPSHDVGELRAFDRVVAWGIVETAGDRTENGMALRFVVGPDGRLRGERTDIPRDESTRVWFYRT